MVGAVVSGVACSSSKAPMSKVLPCGRGTPRLIGGGSDGRSILVTLNQWEQSDPPTSFGALEVKIAEKTSFRIGKLLVKRGKILPLQRHSSCDRQSWIRLEPWKWNFYLILEMDRIT